MRSLLLAFVLVTTPSVFAKSKREAPKSLPRTVIARRVDSHHVAVAFVNGRVKPGSKELAKIIPHLAFEKVALNSEHKRVAYNSKNELDKVKTTESYGFGCFLGQGDIWSGDSGYGGPDGQWIGGLGYPDGEVPEFVLNAEGEEYPLQQYWGDDYEGEQYGYYGIQGEIGDGWDSPEEYL